MSYLRRTRRWTALAALALAGTVAAGPAVAGGLPGRPADHGKQPNPTIIIEG